MRKINYPISIGLKYLRKISSGRLKGYLRGNTELTGGLDAASRLFKDLTGQAVDGDMSRVILKDGREVFFRSADKADSGVPKIEIIDHNKSTLEKISFTND